MRTYSLVAGDLFACLSIVFLVSFGIVAPLSKQEVLTSIQVQKTDKASDVSAPDSREIAALEVAQSPKGPIFELSLPGKPPLRFDNYTTVVRALENESPQEMRIKVDRRVSSGVYQDLILDAQKLGIRTWQENEKP